MSNFLLEKLQTRIDQGNLRSLQTKKKGLIDFSSNDYLGLARSDLFLKVVLQEWEKLHDTKKHLGSTGSRLLTGNSIYAEKLEDKIAAFHGFATGTLFSCGYMANLGLFSAITTYKDIIIFDANIHASSRDGMKLSAANSYPFRHNDLDHLERRLKTLKCAGKRFICIESIYSTDGSKAPLREISELTKKYEAHLIVDEAHAIGVEGPSGKGLISECNLTEDVFALIATFGKALGVFGAIILGSSALKKALLNFARPLIYTTALPLHNLSVISCSYDIFPKMEQERIHVKNLSEILKKSRISTSDTAIHGLIIKGSDRIKKIVNLLEIDGYDVRALLSPTVQKNHEVLRISLHAFNTSEDTIKLTKKIHDLCLIS
jgi:8-amino-7-oxononanoate synthase